MVSKTTFKVRLSNLIPPEDLRELTPSAKKEVSSEIGEFIIDKILSDTSNQRSAVTGQRWKGLSKEYKKIKSKIASSRANLELHGDMLDALKSRVYQGGIEIGIFDATQAQKSDNHNKFSSKSLSTSLPQRQFIPKEGQALRPGIMSEVAKVAKDIVENAPKKGDT